MIVIVLCGIIALALALFFIPRRDDIVIPLNPLQIRRRHLMKRALELVEEKDTKKYFEDIRGLYPL